LSLELCLRFRQALPADEGFRPHFLGHILVEILLDGALIADSPESLDAYYQALEKVDGRCVEDAVNRMAARPTHDLGTFIPLFSRERFLSDYADDGKLLFRLNQVMRRVRLPLLPAGIADLLAACRPLVDARKDELLHGPVATSVSASP
jgi:hypothetical protein